MKFEEMAKLIAFARLCGVEGTGKEILEKFDSLYKSVRVELAAQAKPAEVKIVDPYG